VQDHPTPLPADRQPSVRPSRSMKTRVSAGVARARVDCEYVVTDTARNVIAVVREVRRERDGRYWPPRTMPRWAEKMPVVLGPDGVSGLALGGPPKVRSLRPETWILVEGSVLIGMTGPGAPRSFLTFRDCTCGRPAHKCLCGGRQGRLRYWSAVDGAWRVVDAEDHELARITPRRFARERGPTRAEDTRARLARWAREANYLFFTIGAKRDCELVDVGQRFDWRQHGVLVALAAQCSRCPRQAAWRDGP
jgi:hypothetical protein